MATVQPPRPTTADIVQAGSAVADPYAAISDALNKQISLSEGLSQQRQARYQNLKNFVSGPGTDAVQTLADPTNRAYGQSPIAGLNAAGDLNATFSGQLDRSLEEASSGQKTVLDTLTTLLALQKNKEDSARADKQLKLDERKVALDEKKAQSDGLSVDDLLTTRKALLDAGLDTSAIDSSLQQKGVDTANTAGSKGKQEIVNIIDQILGQDTKPITGLLKIGGSIPGSKDQKTKKLYDQLKAKLSLNNVKYLKGQGAVSDAERALLENASSSISTDLSDTDFRKALDDLKTGLQGDTQGGVSSMVRLKSPDGFVYDVPQSEVQAALSNGYKRM